MEELTIIEEEELKILEEDSANLFFSEDYYLSPSALNKFLWRPRAWFEWYVLKQQEDKDKSKALIEGSLIHLMILEPSKFSERYCVAKEDLVKDKQKKILDKLWFFKSADPKDLVYHAIDLLSLMKEFDYFQALKEDKSRLEKMITAPAIEYWEHLKLANGKRLITQETKDSCMKNADILMHHDKYKALLGLDKRKGIKVYNEVELRQRIPSKKFGLKGIIDNAVLDHNRKKIILNDIKTTSKSLTEFAEESIEFFGYDIQLAIYCMLLIIEFQDLLPQGYEIEVNILCITAYGDAYCFPVSPGTLNRWMIKAREKINEFEWNYNRRDFSNHRVFIENKFTL